LEIDLLIIRVSKELQTEGLETFAFIITSNALSKFSFERSLSKYRCTTQAQVSITGTKDLFLTVFIRSFHHLGIKTSTYFVALNRIFKSFLSSE
jgi:hypothetical protein